MGILFFKQGVNVLTEYDAVRQSIESIAKRQRTVKKVLYVILFDNKNPVMQLLFPKGRTVTGAFYKSVAHFKRRRPKTGLKYLRLLHDNASAQTRIVTGFLESEMVNVLHIPIFHLNWFPVIISCFPNSNSICLEKNIRQEMLLGLLYISSSWVCLFRTMNGAFKI